MRHPIVGRAAVFVSVAMGLILIGIGARWNALSDSAAQSLVAEDAVQDFDGAQEHGSQELEFHFANPGPRPIRLSCIGRS